MEIAFLVSCNNIRVAALTPGWLSVVFCSVRVLFWAVNLLIS